MFFYALESRYHHGYTFSSRIMVCSIFHKDNVSLSVSFVSTSSTMLFSIRYCIKTLNMTIPRHSLCSQLGSPRPQFYRLRARKDESIPKSFLLVPSFFLCHFVGQILLFQTRQFWEKFSCDESRKLRSKVRFFTKIRFCPEHPDQMVR